MYDIPVQIESKYLLKILDSLESGMNIVDKNGTIIWVNQACCKIFNKRKEDLIGRNIFVLKKEGAFTPSVIEMVLQNKSTVTTVQEIIGGNKMTVTGEIILDEQENPLYFVAHGHDIRNWIKNISQLGWEELAPVLKQHLLEIKKINTQYIISKDEQFFIGHGKVNHLLAEIIDRVASVDSTVLINGETGVGKNVVAKRIHDLSERNNQPFVHINCAAIPDSLLESELFGYHKGAFTGANSKGKSGLVKIAEKGTIFLDEISELPLHLQPKLLQLLQDKTYMPIGGSQLIKADIRIITATNRKIEDMVQEGKFRADLYYRLHVLPINIPPLRERKEDIFPFLHFYLQKYNKRFNQTRTLSRQTIDVLQRYQWPGNIRELEHTVEQLVIMAKKEEISIHDLPERFVSVNIETEALESLKEGNNLNEIIERIEKRMIEQAMKENKTTRKTATVLGITQTSLIRRLKKYNIRNEKE
ncbi:MULTISPECIES: sigma-54 interaction domain-containing protein [Bacillus cereus group]|uniref:sigma-54 interaction domain-containing protein n=1 Tax=Bacillus cereus group TaxID=86661 RepID=UPI0001A09AEF|nr:MULTISPECIES: sigma 54-interacting transcriptional regulator [Bacillus cereus group]EEL51110.1 Sigma54 specific transcriptional regulator, Fis [Bacillus cereus Rock3-44]PFO84382.1 transcriptional regulator [Bacillus cereus]